MKFYLRLKIFHWRRCAWKAVCEMAAILSRPQCVKEHFSFDILQVCTYMQPYLLLCMYWHRDNSVIGIMMTSSNGNIFRVTGFLCGKFTGHRWIPRTKGSDVELWCFLWSAPWTNIWANTGDAEDLRRHRAHYVVIVMILPTWFGSGAAKTVPGYKSCISHLTLDAYYHQYWSTICSTQWKVSHCGILWKRKVALILFKKTLTCFIWK